MVASDQTEPTMAEPGVTAGRRGSGLQPAAEPQVAWLAGVLAVCTAAITVGLFTRLSDNARWAPFVGWLVAGSVAGLILRHRLIAVKVAAVSTVGASVATGVLAWFITRPHPTAVKHPAEFPAPAASEVMVRPSSAAWRRCWAPRRVGVLPLAR